MLVLDLAVSNEVRSSGSSASIGGAGVGLGGTMTGGAGLDTGGFDLGKLKMVGDGMDDVEGDCGGEGA